MLRAKQAQLVPHAQPMLGGRPQDSQEMGCQGRRPTLGRGCRRASLGACEGSGGLSLMSVCRVASMDVNAVIVLGCTAARRMPALHSR